MIRPEHTGGCRPLCLNGAPAVSSSRLLSPASAILATLDGPTSAGEVFFPWARSGGFGANWAEGIGFAALGIIGALVTVYFLLGSFLPSMGGKAEYDETRVELEDLIGRRDAQLAIRERFARGEMPALPPAQLAEADRLTAELTAAVDKKADLLEKQRRGLQLVGFPLYVVLGAAFAVLFATNALQALLIGFGWTAIADRVGLGKELDVKATRREVQIAKLQREAEGGVQARSEVEALRARNLLLEQSAELSAEKLVESAHPAE